MATYLTGVRARRIQSTLECLEDMTKVVTQSHHRDYLQHIGLLDVNSLQIEEEFIVGLLRHVRHKIEIKKSEPTEIRNWIEENLLQKWSEYSASILSAQNPFDIRYKCVRKDR
jgi:hypothetical protein